MLLLPDEIYDIILGHASRKTLRTARLVCKQFSQIGGRHLFSTVYLKVTVDSFINLERISKHAQLSLNVRRLVYDPALLPWDLNSFELYLNQGAAAGLSLTPAGYTAGRTFEDLVQDFVHYYSPLQLEYHYQQYCRYLAGQKYIHRDDNEAEQLAEIFKGLQRLEKIEIATWDPQEDRSSLTRSLWGTYTPFPGFSGIVAKQTLVQPEWHNRFRLKRLLSVMKASREALRSIKYLNTCCIDIQKLGNAARVAEQDYMETFMAGLTQLQLDLTDSVTIPDSTAYLQGFVSLASNLETLDLVGNCASPSNPQRIDFPGALKESVWEHLKTLRLSLMSVSQEDFSEFLVNHAKSLKSLEMGSLDIRGSFVESLMFLAEHMQLKRLVLQGTFANFSDENWVIRPPCDAQSSTRFNYKECLLDRVVNYVVSDGHFPFIRLTDQGKKSILTEAKGPQAPTILTKFEARKGEHAWLAVEEDETFYAVNSKLEVIFS